jgi:hypothetical protein
MRSRKITHNSWWNSSDPNTEFRIEYYRQFHNWNPEEQAKIVLDLIEKWHAEICVYQIESMLWFAENLHPQFGRSFGNFSNRLIAPHMNQLVLVQKTLYSKVYRLRD